MAVYSPSETEREKESGGTEMKNGTWLVSMLLPVCFAAAGCGGSCPQPETPEREVRPIVRSAVEDSNIRALLRDVAAAQLCSSLEGGFSGLPDSDSEADGGVTPSGGRLWIRECEVESQGDQLVVSVGGPGWAWLSQGKSGFAVRDYLRLSALMTITGELDLAYNRDKRVVSVWFSPRGPVRSKVAPIGNVPVVAENVLAKILSAFSSVREYTQEEARDAVIQDGADLFNDALENGFTLTADLCRGQVDSLVGALRNGEAPVRPYPSDELRWLANERVKLRRGGLDVAGPWQMKTAPLSLDIEVEEGPGIEVRVVCQRQAEEVVDAYLHRRDEPSLTAHSYATIGEGQSNQLTVDTRDCPLVMLVRPSGEGDDPVTFRFRAREQGARAEPMVHCSESTPEEDSEPAAQPEEQ